MRTLTREQWVRVVMWIDYAERVAKRHCPMDRDASHDLALDSVMRAVRYADEPAIAHLLSKIIRGEAWKRTAKQKRFGRIRERIESLDRVVQDDWKTLQYADATRDRVDVDDVIDYIANGLHHTIPVFLRAVARGEEHRHACESRGLSYLGVRGSVRYKLEVLRARLASQLETIGFGSASHR